MQIDVVLQTGDSRIVLHRIAIMCRIIGALSTTMHSLISAGRHKPCIIPLAADLLPVLRAVYVVFAVSHVIRNVRRVRCGVPISFFAAVAATAAIVPRFDGQSVGCWHETL